MRQLMGVVGDTVPGGRQAEKTFQGLDTALRGGRYSGYGEDERLMYPVDVNPFTALKAALFGYAALEENGEYYASGEKALSASQTRLYQSMVAGGGDKREIYGAILDWRKIQNDMDLTGEEKARLGETIVGGVELGDRQKLEFYQKLTGADSRAEKLKALLDAGMDWDGAIGAYAQYDEINRTEGMTASEKATEFARWADENYPQKQAAAAKEQFRYYFMVPAEAGRYEKFSGAGLGTDDAYRLTEILSGLQPEPEKTQVSNMQKYKAVVSAGLSQAEQLAALGTLMGEDEYKRLSVGNEYGVAPELYIAVKEALLDIGNVTQRNAKSAINSLTGLTTEQKAALWQMQNKNWSSFNNPFSTKVGREVREEINEEVEGLSLPEW